MFKSHLRTFLVGKAGNPIGKALVTSRQKLFTLVIEGPHLAREGNTIIKVNIIQMPSGLFCNIWSCQVNPCGIPQGKYVHKSMQTRA